METKQHATKKTNGSMMKSKRKLKNTLRQMTMKIQSYKNPWATAEQFLEGSSL